MWLQHRLSALLQRHLHSRLNTCLQWIRQRPLQDEMANIQVLGSVASYIGGFEGNSSFHHPVPHDSLHSMKNLHHWQNS